MTPTSRSARRASVAHDADDFPSHKLPASNRALMGIRMNAAELSAATALSEAAQKLLHGLCNCDRIFFGLDHPAPLAELIARGVEVVLGEIIDFGGGLVGRRVGLHPDILSQL